MFFWLENFAVRRRHDSRVSLFTDWFAFDEKCGRVMPCARYFLPSDKKVANKNVWISWSNAVISLASKQQIGTIATPLLFFAGYSRTQFYINHNRVLCNTYIEEESSLKSLNLLIHCMFSVPFFSRDTMYLILWLRFCYYSCDANAMAKKMFSAQIIHSQAEITVNENAVAPDFSLINWKTGHIWKQLYDPGNRGCRNVALSGHLCDNTSQIWLWYDRTSEFIKIKNSSTSRQFGLPSSPLLPATLLNVPLFIALVEHLPLTRKPRDSLTLTISSSCSLCSSFSPTCIKFCEYMTYIYT